MTMDPGTFRQIAPDVARALLGEPNKRLSKKDELRFGSQGSKSLKVKDGVYFNHETNAGGGVLFMVQDILGVEQPDAVKWLVDHDYLDPPEETRPAPKKANGNGAHHAPPPARQASAWLPPGVPDGATIGATYDYTDEDGRLLFQVVRYEWALPDGGRGKTFRQRRPDSAKRDGWNWATKGVRQVLFGLPDVVEAMAAGETIVVVEGEKDVATVRELGFAATCNAMGAGKWSADAHAGLLAGADVLVLADNDEPGIAHRDAVVRSLDGVARRVRVLDLPGLDEKQDVTDWVERHGGTPAAFRDLVETRAVEPLAKPFVSRFGAVSWRDLDQPAIEHEWLVKGLLTRCERSIFAGASGSGKSFLAIDCAMAIARGRPFFGRGVMRGGVVYQAGEGGLGVRNRLRSYRQFHGVSIEDDVPFVLLPASIDLYASDDHTDRLIEEARHFDRRVFRSMGVGLELIVIDTLSAAVPGANENASEDVSRVLARCARLSQATGAHVMLVHHMNAEGNRIRGHSSILANIDSVLIVRLLDGMRDADGRPIREVTLTKAKDAESGASWRFVLPRVEISKDRDGEPVTSCVVTLPRRADQSVAGLPEDLDEDTKGAAKLRADEQPIYDAVVTALAEHGIDPPAGVRAPRGAKVARKLDVWREYRRKYVVGEEESDPKAEERRVDALRRRVSRAMAGLVRARVVGMDEGHIWLTSRRVAGYGPVRVVTASASAPLNSAMQSTPAPAPHGEPPSSSLDLTPDDLTPADQGFGDLLE